MAYQEFDVGDAGRLSLKREAKLWSKRLYKIFTGDIEMRDGLKSKTVQRYINETTNNLVYSVDLKVLPQFTNMLRSTGEAIRHEIYEREIKLAVLKWLGKNQTRLIQEILNEL